MQKDRREECVCDIEYKRERVSERERERVSELMVAHLFDDDGSCHERPTAAEAANVIEKSNT